MKVIFDKSIMYVLQSVSTGEFITVKKGAGKGAVFGWTQIQSEAAKFTAEEANTLIAATAVDNGGDNENNYSMFEQLKGIEVPA